MIIKKFQILVSKSGHQCGGRSHYIYDMNIYFNIPYKSLKDLRNVVFFNSNDSMIFDKKSETEVNVNNRHLDYYRIRLKR